MEKAALDFAGVLNVFYLTTRSIEDGLEESVGGEIALFVATCELARSSSPCVLRRGFHRVRLRFCAPTSAGGAVPIFYWCLISPSLGLLRGEDDRGAEAERYITQPLALLTVASSRCALHLL